MNDALEQLRKAADLSAEEKAGAKRDAIWESAMREWLHLYRQEIADLSARMSTLFHREKRIVWMFACHTFIQHGLWSEPLPDTPEEIEAYNRALAKIAGECAEAITEGVRRAGG